MAKTISQPATTPSPLDSPKTRAAFVKCVRAGNFRACACGVAGVSPAEMTRYLRSASPAAVAFKAAVTKAEADVEAEMVGSIVRAAKKGDAAAARWLLDARTVRKITEAILRMRDAGVK